MKVDGSHRLMFWLRGVTKKKKLAYFAFEIQIAAELRKEASLFSCFLAGNIKKSSTIAVSRFDEFLTFCPKLENKLF